MPEMTRLKEMILKMGALAEDIFQKANRTVRERDPALGREVIRDDLAIDWLELEIDEAVLRVLALSAPVAGDLRLVVAIKTMATDLERVGDLARNIAQSGIRLAERVETDIPPRLERLQDEAQRQLRRALDAFQRQDTALAREVLGADDQVDDLQDRLVAELVSEISDRPETAKQALDVILIAENLERVADHATNIAEDVLLVAEARNVKHAERLGSEG